MTRKDFNNQTYRIIFLHEIQKHKYTASLKHILAIWCYNFWNFISFFYKIWWRVSEASQEKQTETSLYQIMQNVQNARKCCNWRLEDSEVVVLLKGPANNWKRQNLKKIPKIQHDLFINYSSAVLLDFFFSLD